MWELFWVYNLNKHSQGNPSSRVSHFTMKNFGCCHHGCLTVSLGYPPQRRLRQRVTFLAQIWSPLGQVMFIFTTSGKSRKRIWKQCSSSTLTMLLFYIFSAAMAWKSTYAGRTGEHTSNPPCMANITFPFAALMLLHWAIHGAMASIDPIFFTSLV